MFGGFGFGKLEYTLCFMLFVLPIPFGIWKLIEIFIWLNKHLHITYK